jgi:hypothetical protein
MLADWLEEERPLVAVITERISLNEEIRSDVEVDALLDGRPVSEAGVEIEEIGVEMFVIMLIFYS